MEEQTQAPQGYTKFSRRDGIRDSAVAVFTSRYDSIRTDNAQFLASGRQIIKLSAKFENTFAVANALKNIEIFHNEITEKKKNIR